MFIISTVLRRFPDALDAADDIVPLICRKGGLTPPIFVSYDIPLKNIQDMAYGTNVIVTYGMRSLAYGIIRGGSEVSDYSVVPSGYSRAFLK